MKKILIIEDNTDIRENTATILEMAGYEVFTAENGRFGIDEARRSKPDLVVCDVMMPELDGFGVLHILRKDPKFQDIPFIFLTAKSERADYRKSMDLGADDFLSKPFALMELLTSIEARLDKASSKSITQIFSKEITENDKAAWVQKLFSISQVKRFSVKRKTSIIQEASIAHQLVLVERGIVKAFSIHHSGKILITDLYFKGDIIGLADLIVNKTFSITAESVSDAELAVIPVQDLTDYVSRFPKEAEFISHFVCSELIQKQAKLIDMAYTPMRERVANLMESLEQKLDANHLDEITDYFTREELAQMAGTATESLIRVLGGKQ
jgi:DNA-binding response OmpR family regulator